MTADVDAAIEGLVRCDCGCKYWEDGKCIDCGTSVAQYPDQLREIGVLK